MNIDDQWDAQWAKLSKVVLTPAQSDAAVGIQVDFGNARATGDDAGAAGALAALSTLVNGTSGAAPYVKPEGVRTGSLVLAGFLVAAATLYFTAKKSK